MRRPWQNVGGDPRAARMLAAACLLCAAAPAQARPAGDAIRLGVERRALQKVRVQLAPLEVDSREPRARDGARQLAERVVRDLHYTGLIAVAEPLPDGVASPRGRAAAGDPGDASGTAEAFVVALRLEGDDPARMVWTGRLLEPGGVIQKAGKRYTVDLADAMRSAHHFADEVVLQLTGEPGIAQTRVLFSRGSGEVRELYLVDYDGENIRQVTRNASLNLTPRWSPDLARIAYTSYFRGRQRLLVLDTATGRSTRVADFDGLNVDAAWSPAGTELAVTLSRDGNAEIYRVRPNGDIIQRLTFDPSIECSPCWDPTGQQIAFTSDRTGSPQVYVMDRDGTNRRRITFDGRYNDSAAWSPQGDRIAYVSRVEGQFQVFSVEPDGSDVHQITFPQERDNEDPSWAPDGRHLVVSSNRSGSTNLWVIDVESGEARPLTWGRAEDTGPSWGGPPAATARVLGSE